MLLLLFSFLAGVLTVLAPCVLPLLPIIIGSSSGSDKKWKPYVIVASLLFSITVFTLLLRATTAFIFIDPSFWQYLSGSILVFLGLTYLFPNLWVNITTTLGFARKSDEFLDKSKEKDGVWGSILSGVALGPVFTSCSPTYSLILTTVLPANWIWGLTNLLAYNLGLTSVLLAISVFGQSLVKKLKIVSKPDGWFKLSLGGLFLLVGVAIIFGWHKDVEAWVIDTFGATFTAWENQYIGNFN
jgi:cytochrome c biogenesis protein CcdA